MKIIQLTASNLMRLKAIDITPVGDTVVISGRNAQGKTSVLNAIWFALGGAPAQKGIKKPIRDGEQVATVRLDLGDIVVTRSWKGEDSTLTVASADGARYGSPQGMLDKLVGSLSFDPLAWSTKNDKDQLADLLKLIELPFDLDEMAGHRKAFYEDRTEANREFKRSEQYLSLVAYANETEPVDIDALFTERRKADEHNAVELANANRTASFHLEIEDLERRLEVLRTSLAAVPKSQGLIDIAHIEQKLDSASETNRAAEAWKLKVMHTADMAAHKQRRDALTTRIEELDTMKVTAVAAAEMPVPGLSFDDDGVTFEGVPFRQCSGAERLRVSLAMAMALNPEIRVIRITDGSLLDRENMALIREMASANGHQVWIERVEDNEAQFVIEDGEVL